ncbi:MAG: GNAT family N-acetyltransferase [Pseudomonadota bacterium]
MIPTVLENEHFRLRTLTVNDVVKDYDAVMSSWDHLQGVFGPNSDWPQADLSLEQDLIDLGWHQKEFQIRSSFTYTVVSLDEERVLGCVYIFPTTRGDFDASVTMWVRADVVDDGYDAKLYQTVMEWIAADWPFKKAAYPGRDVSWEDWGSLE